MLIYKVTLLLIYFISVAKGFPSLDQKTWTYEIKSIECTSSNIDLLNIDLQKERISRGVYAVTGEFSLKFDIFDNDENTFGAKSYRSAMGDGDYKSLPFQMPPTQWIKYLNSYYKDTIMESLKECSDLPYFKDKFVGPLPKKRYTLTKCQFSQDGFPNHLQDGMYKLIIYGNGTVDWQILSIFEVQKIV